MVNGKVILIPQFGGIKQVVAEETDKENKPAVICLPPLGEYLDYGVFTETGNNLSGGRPSKEYAISIDLAKTVNTRSISKYSFVGGTDFRSKMSKSSDGYQF